MTLHDVFKPLKRTDSVSCINLFPEAVVVSFERTELGKRLTYVKIAHPTQLPRLRVKWTTSVTRILFFRPGALLTALATGQPVGIDLWVTNNSEKLDKLNLNQESLVFHVRGLGDYSLNAITSVSGGDFALFGPGVKDPYNTGCQQGQKWADIGDQTYGMDTHIAAKYGPVGQEVTK